MINRMALEQKCPGCGDTAPVCNVEHWKTEYGFSSTYTVSCQKFGGTQTLQNRTAAIRKEVARMVGELRIMANDLEKAWLDGKDSR